MTLTTTERITVNGYDLKTLCWNIDTLAATLRAAGKRSGNVQAAGRHGTIFVPGKKRGENVLRWPMWIIGADADGAVPGGSTARKEFFKRVDELNLIMNGYEDQQEVKHYLPDGTVRVFHMEILSVMDYTTRGENPIARIDFDLNMADPFFAEDTEQVIEIPMGLGWVPGLPTALTALGGGNAPIEDAKVEIHSPPSQLIIKSGHGENVELSFDGNGFAPDDVIYVDSKTHEIQVASYEKMWKRENLHQNPSLEVNATGYTSFGAVANLARVTSSIGYVPHGTACGQYEKNVTGYSVMFLHGTDAATFTSMNYIIGQTYTWSFYFRYKSGTPASQDVICRANFFNDVGTSLGFTDGATVTALKATDLNAPNRWYRLSVTATIPLFTTRMDLSWFTTTPNDTGLVFNFDAALIEEGTVLRPYFDGASTVRSEWRGTANNSASTQYLYRQNRHTNPSLETNTTGFANAVQSGAITRVTTGGGQSGTAYGQSTATGTGSHYIQLAPRTTAEFAAAGYVPGRTYILSAYIRLRVGSPSASVSFLASIKSYTSADVQIESVDGASVPVIRSTADGIAAHWYRVSVVATLPTNTGRVDLVLAGGTVVSGDIMNWDSILLEESSVLDTFFDGTFANAGWQGTANNSVSRLALARRNLHPNPSLEENVTGWSHIGSGPGPMTRQTGGYVPSGVAWGKWTVAGGISPIIGTIPRTLDAFAATGMIPGRVYTLSAFFRLMDGVAVSRLARLEIAFYDSALVHISTLAMSDATIPRATDQNLAAGWTRLSTFFTVPAGAAAAEIIGRMASMATGESFHLDAVQLEPGVWADSYGDGNSAGWEWDGPTDLSSSGMYVKSGTPEPAVDLNDYTYVGHQGDSRYLYLTPGQDGVYRVTLDGSAVGVQDSSKVVIRARRKFQTG